MKSKGIAYMLNILGFFGVAGLHRFYLGKVGTGILWFVTVGFLGIGTVIDLFTLGEQVEQYNTNVQVQQLRKAAPASRASS